MKKIRVSLMLESDLVAAVDRIVIKRREKEEPSLKVISRSQVVEELIRKGLRK